MVMWFAYLMLANQNLTQVSQLYVQVSFCLKVIRSWHNLPTGGHGHVICMHDYDIILFNKSQDCLQGDACNVLPPPPQIHTDMCTISR